MYKKLLITSVILVSSSVNATEIVNKLNRNPAEPASVSEIITGCNMLTAAFNNGKPVFDRNAILKYKKENPGKPIPPVLKQTNFLTDSKLIESETLRTFKIKGPNLNPKEFNFLPYEITVRFKPDTTFMGIPVTELKYSADPSFNYIYFVSPNLNEIEVFQKLSQEAAKYNLYDTTTHPYFRTVLMTLDKGGDRKGANFGCFTKAPHPWKKQDFNNLALRVMPAGDYNYETAEIIWKRYKSVLIDANLVSKYY